MGQNCFGGNWTIDKLNILGEYLDFYLKVLQNRNFYKIYIDAFAGSGSIILKESHQTIDGSAKLALSGVRKFDKYFFIERNKKNAKQLKNCIYHYFPDSYAISEVIQKDCNEALIEICEEINWIKSRAVLFLDPYGTGVKWSTLQKVAATKAMDVWYLFPLQGAIRMMKNDGMIQESWKQRLDEIFGDDSWFEKFYTISDQLNLFDQDEYVKKCNLEELKDYIISRLGSLFTFVSRDSKILFNSNNFPIFLFCFATANDSDKAIDLARKGANYILKMSHEKRGELLEKC